MTRARLPQTATAGLWVSSSCFLLYADMFSRCRSLKSRQTLQRHRFYTQSTQGLILHIPRSSIFQLGSGSSSSPLFSDVTWTIQPNDAWVVMSVGSSNAKTLLLRTLTGHLKITPPPPPPDGLFPFLKGRDPHNHVSLVSFAHRSRAAGGAFYDYTARYGAVREEDKRTLRETFFPEIARPLHNLAVPGFHAHPGDNSISHTDKVKEETRRVLFEGLTERLGLTQFLDLPLIALSNGQTRKARIVKALLEQPELLILDEPLSELHATFRSCTHLPAIYFFGPHLLPRLSVTLESRTGRSFVCFPLDLKPTH